MGRDVSRTKGRPAKSAGRSAKSAGRSAGRLSETTLRIMEAIRAVPPGKVSSYGAVALAAGLRNGARQAARILHSMAGPHKLPWHRIVRSGGSIALEPGRGREEQIGLLRSEGVRVSRAGTVDMGIYGVE